MKPLPRFTIVERPGRMQPFTIYGGDQIWFYASTHEEATAYIERQIRGFA